MLSSNTADSTVVYCGILNLWCCIPTLSNGYSCFLSKGQVQPSDWLNLGHDLFCFVSGSKESSTVRRRVLEGGSPRLENCIKYFICGVSSCNHHRKYTIICQWKCLAMFLITGLFCGRKLLSFVGKQLSCCYAQDQFQLDSTFANMNMNGFSPRKQTSTVSVRSEF